jgi:preprotein translocase subunit YajC
VHASLLAKAVMVLPAATSSGSSSSGKGSSFAPFLVLIVLFGVGYFFITRSARKRQQATVEARKQIQPGEEIITTSGLIATVVEVNDDALLLEIAPGVRARFVPAAVLRVISAEPEGEETPDVTNHEVIEAPDEPTDPPDGSSSS